MALKSKWMGDGSSPARDASADTWAQTAPPTFDESSIPALARGAVETYVSHRCIIKPALPSPNSLLGRPSACFVCIKTFGRELRGCVGTVEPEKETLAAEVVANAIKAATRDPRFHPLSQNELPSLRYSEDVLGAFEPARFEDLDPTVFGLMVVDRSGSRRGLLLPNIESIKTADVQISVAARKAGIKPDEPLRLYRFRTRRFSEWD
jgi:AmmeMemoRadiSam system protein A